MYHYGQKYLTDGSHEDTQLVFITADPERDTPARLKHYVETFGPDFIGLTGDRATLARVEERWNSSPAAIT